MRKPTALSLALALALGSIPSLAQSPPLEVEIDSWGTREFTLGNFTGTRYLNLLAGKTPALGSTPLEAVPSSVWVGGVESPNPISQYGHILYRAQIQSGQMYEGRVHYHPDGPRFLHVRVRASQGNMFNAGKVILTDDPNYNRDTARYVYGEVSANGGIPAWQTVLGMVFWVTGWGAPLTPILWGTTSNTAEYTLTLPRNLSSLTLYYKMTGCTATSDFNASFTVPISSLQPGVAYALDIYGWCGFAGVGNLARAVQRAVAPRPLSLADGWSVFHSIRDPNVPGYEIRVTTNDFSIGGPDDCGGNYTAAPYDYRKGIHFKISGVGCWTDGFGAPGDMNAIRATLPSLTANARGLWRFSGFSSSGFSSDEFLILYYLLSPRINWDNWPTFQASATFTPRGFYYGNFSTTSVPGTATGGGETISASGRVFTFSMTDGRYGENVLDYGSSLSFPPVSLTLPNYLGTCTLRNGSGTVVTVYELTPPTTFTVHSLLGSSSYTFPRRTLNPGGTVSLGRPGLYYFSPNTVPLNAAGGITASGCSIVQGFTHNPTGETSVLYGGFFVLR
ncbi:hypothetical protein [Thermus sp.]|uniref:hypothetical protein n=1 Tax=Thermus sp. TaxID=275 RepID=UPI00298EEAF1|nr:hypothetical protein [Thermus sp.]MDW8358908.1 hypothetical protein [Thermus sp.]